METGEQIIVGTAVGKHMKGCRKRRMLTRKPIMLVSLLASLLNFFIYLLACLSLFVFFFLLSLNDYFPGSIKSTRTENLPSFCVRS